MGWVAGCSPEEDPRGEGYIPLVGTWQLIEKKVFNDSIYVPVRILATPLNTLTFGAEGVVSSTGKETEYYRSSRYYQVDSTFNGLKIGFLTGSIYPAFYQGLRLKADTLELAPCPANACNLKFVRSR
jgi:hypothetical protein